MGNGTERKLGRMGKWNGLLIRMEYNMLKSNWKRNRKEMGKSGQGEWIVVVGPGSRCGKGKGGSGNGKRMEHQMSQQKTGSEMEMMPLMSQN